MTKPEPRHWKISTLRAEFWRKLRDLGSFPASQKLPSLEASPKENICRGKTFSATKDSVKGCFRREHGNRDHTPSRTPSRSFEGFIPTEQGWIKGIKASGFSMHPRFQSNPNFRDGTLQAAQEDMEQGKQSFKAELSWRHLIHSSPRILDQQYQLSQLCSHPSFAFNDLKTAQDDVKSGSTWIFKFSQLLQGGGQFKMTSK